MTQFQNRVHQYVVLRDKVAKAVKGTSDGTASEVQTNQAVLTQRVQAERAGAKYGDLFTPEMRTYIRGVVSSAMEGGQGIDVRAEAAADAPAPGSVALEVNAVYPANVTFATTPAPLLAALPRLPVGIEFRFIGRDMLLIDQATHLILDYMRNALPERK